MKHLKKNNIYKINGDLKYTLIKLFAALAIFSAGVSINNNTEEEIENLTNDRSDDFLCALEEFITANQNNIVNISKVSDSSILIEGYNASTSLSFLDGKFVSETTYINGEKAVKFSSNAKDVLSTVNFLSFDEYNGLINALSGQEDLSVFYDDNGNITNEGKEYFVMKYYGISQEELDYVLAGPMAEGIENNYVDVSAAMRTGINRLFSYAWVYHAIDRLNLDVDVNGVTIYHIFKDPKQFAVYDNGRYLQFLGVKDSTGYQAAIDTLYDVITLKDVNADIVYHDYLEFQDKGDPIHGGYSSVQFTRGGNKHYRHIKKSDIIPISDSILAECSTVKDIFGDLSPELIKIP